MADDLFSLVRRVMRGTAEAAFVNTLNLGDRVTVEFVWYPGEAGTPSDSLVDVMMPIVGTQPERVIEYTWARSGQPPLRRPMLLGRITVPLPPGGTGTLTVFDTSWQITRNAAGVAMSAATTVLGVQQRLNKLGYHLRAPGAAAAGVDSQLGRRTERAILQFQADYRPQAGAAGAAANRQLVRGEWTANPEIVSAVIGGTDATNSAGDGANTQAALVAAAGG